MHARRFACFVLGLWLGGGIFLAWLTSVNLKTADRLVAQASPAARLQLKTLGPNAPAVLRYQASEENRQYRRRWETVQIILGTLFFGLMLFGSRESKYVLGGIVLLLLMVALERFVVTPAVAAQGRLLDFAAPDAASGERNRYWVLESSYLAIEGVKGLLTMALAAGMVFSRKRSGRSRDSRHKLDQVDKPNYSRVNW
jgi:hypothetical protein